jgi:hypothetical protein
MSLAPSEARPQAGLSREIRDKMTPMLGEGSFLPAGLQWHQSLKDEPVRIVLYPVISFHCSLALPFPIRQLHHTY